MAQPGGFRACPGDSSGLFCIFCSHKLISASVGGDKKTKQKKNKGFRWLNLAGFGPVLVTRSTGNINLRDTEGAGAECEFLFVKMQAKYHKRRSRHHFGA